jgi:hypothetical protein
MKQFKRGILVTTAACVLAAGAAAPAQANSSRGCGGTWGEGQTSCNFRYDGGGIVVRIGKDSGVFGSVRLETGGGATYKLYLVCDALFGPCVMATYSPEDLMPRGTELRCIAHGAQGSGRFGCTSGEEFAG